MSDIDAIQVVIDGLKTSVTNLAFKNNVLQEENKKLKALLKAKKKLWVGFEDQDLREMGVDGPIKYTWVCNAEEKLKQLNT
jgi:regulator of replication initiation timing